MHPALFPRSQAEPAAAVGGLEADLDALLAGGDPAAAATAAIRAFGEPIHRYFHSMLRDGDEAADAHSIWAERLWRGIGGFKGQSSLRTWAYRIAKNVALSLRGDAWHRHRTRLTSGKASDLAAEVRSGSAPVGDHLVTALDAIRRELSPDDQSLLALRCDQALSWIEVAEVLAGEGERVEVAALQKRFERLKKKVGKLARHRGMRV